MMINLFNSIQVNLIFSASQNYNNKIINKLVFTNNDETKKIFNIIKNINFDELKNLLAEKYAFIFSLCLVGLNIKEINDLFFKISTQMIYVISTQKKIIISENNIKDFLKNELNINAAINRKLNNYLVQIIRLSSVEGSAIKRLFNYDQNFVLYISSKLVNIINFNSSRKDEHLEKTYNFLLQISQEKTLESMFSTWNKMFINISDILYQDLRDNKSEKNKFVSFMFRILNLQIDFYIELLKILYKKKYDKTEILLTNIAKSSPHLLDSEVGKISQQISEKLKEIDSKKNGRLKIKNTNGIPWKIFLDLEKKYDFMSAEEEVILGFNAWMSIDLLHKNFIFIYDGIKTHEIFMNKNININILPKDLYEALLEFNFQFIPTIKSFSLANIKVDDGLYNKDFLNLIYKNKKWIEFLSKENKIKLSAELERYNIELERKKIYIKYFVLFMEDLSVLVKLINSKMTKENISKLTDVLMKKNIEKNQVIEYLSPLVK